MNILCLETTTNTCSIALHTSNGIHNKNVDKGLRHSAVITLFIQDVLQQAQIEINQLDAVAVSQGPGSYTGLRVGYSTAKALCFAQDIPLIEVDTLQALAKAHQDEANRIIPMIDARRMEVYYSIWDQDNNRIGTTNNFVIDAPFCMVDKDKYEVLICGDGASKAMEYWSDPKIKIGRTVLRAEDMITIAIEKYQREDFSDIAYAIPHYLKAPKITKSNKLLI